MRSCAVQKRIYRLLLFDCASDEPKSVLARDLGNRLQSRNVPFGTSGDSVHILFQKEFCVFYSFFIRDHNVGLGTHGVGYLFGSCAAGAVSCNMPAGVI